MAANTIGIVHPSAPKFLRHVLRDRAGAAKVLCRRNLHHRVPIQRRVVVRRCPLIGRRQRGVIKELTGFAAQLGRIDQPVAANPDLVVHVRRQIRNDVATGIVGDDYLGKFGWQLGRLCDDPNTGFGPRRAAYDAADVNLADRHCGRLLRGNGRGEDCAGDGGCAGNQTTNYLHEFPRKAESRHQSLVLNRRSRLALHPSLPGRPQGASTTS